MPGNLNKLIAAALKVDESLLDDNASMQTIPQWDSLAQMSLVAASKSQYQVRFEPEDVVAMVAVKNIADTPRRLNTKLD